MLSLFINASCTVLTFDWAREEVAVVDIAKPMKGTEVHGVIVDVKNIAGLDDGQYMIPVPREQIIGDGPVSAAVAPEGSSAQSWDRKRATPRATGLAVIPYSFNQWWSAPALDDLVPAGITGDVFNLRAEVRRTPSRRFSVALFVDRRRTGEWVSLGQWDIGEGSQSGARKLVAYAALPVTVPLDACGVAVGTVVVWAIWIPALVVLGIGGALGGTN